MSNTLLPIRFYLENTFITLTAWNYTLILITILTMILSCVKMVISIRQYRTKIVVQTRSAVFALCCLKYKKSKNFDIFFPISNTKIYAI